MSCRLFCSSYWLAKWCLALSIGKMTSSLLFDLRISNTNQSANQQEAEEKGKKGKDWSLAFACFSNYVVWYFCCFILEYVKDPWFCIEKGACLQNFFLTRVSLLWTLRAHSSCILSSHLWKMFRTESEYKAEERVFFRQTFALEMK